jgi:hypothetical protein
MNLTTLKAEYVASCRSTVEKLRSELALIESLLEEAENDLTMAEQYGVPCHAVGDDTQNADEEKHEHS